jgi:hypothetical protein
VEYDVLEANYLLNGVEVMYIEAKELVSRKN